MACFFCFLAKVPDLVLLGLQEPIYFSGAPKYCNDFAMYSVGCHLGEKHKHGTCRSYLSRTPGKLARTHQASKLTDDEAPGMEGFLAGNYVVDFLRYFSKEPPPTYRSFFAH